MNRWFGKLLMVFAIELEKFEQSVTSLIKESIPGLSRDLLPEWERDLGLPDECLSPVQSIEERAQIAHSKYTSPKTGQSKQFFIDYAATLGATISVYEFDGIGTTFRANKSLVDRQSASVFPGTPSERVFEARVWSSGVVHKWVINFSSITGDVTQENIECLLLAKIPAHTEVHFTNT